MATFTISANIRRDIAEAIVKESEPSYDTRYYGAHYAVDIDGDNELDAVMLKEETAPWEPWHDDAVAIAVADPYNGETFDSSFDPDLGGTEEDAYEATVLLALDELPATYTSEEE